MAGRKSKISGLTPGRWFLWISGGFLVLASLSALAMTFGTKGWDPGIWRGFFHGGLAPGPESAILRYLRGPRIAAALLVGWALGTAGALYQGMLQNPLADPYLLGISGGAALGSTLAALYEPTLTHRLQGSWMAAGGFAGALLFTALIYHLARVRHRLPVLGLILAGVVLNAVAGAFILFITATRDPARVQRIALWIIGQVQPQDWFILGIAGLWIGFWSMWAWKDAPYLNLMVLGEDVMASWGMPVDRLRTRWLVFGAALSAMAVYLAGMVGFVGLIVPHAVRMIMGHDHRWTLPMAGFAGAALVLSADTAARTLWSPLEMPVGVLTAGLAGPYFLWLLRRSLKNMTIL